MEDCFCGERAWYFCNACKLFLWEEHKKVHENSKKKIHVFEELWVQVAPEEIVEMTEDLSRKIKMIKECAKQIIIETNKLCDKIRTLCAKTLKGLQQKEQEYCNLVIDIHARLSQERLVDIKRLLQVSFEIRIPLKEFTDINTFYASNFLNEVNEDKPRRGLIDIVLESRRCSHLELYKIEFEGPIYAKPTERFGVVIYKATYPNHPFLLAVKEYTAKIDISHLEVFVPELTILHILSDHACDDNCYLKYYGSWTNENKLYLVMEYADYSLAFIIREYKEFRFHLDEDVLKKITYKLILSFAEMEAMKIHHKNIEPSNLLVTNNFGIKIIGFSNSEVKDSMDYTSSITRMHPVQGTNGYMAPELQKCYDEGTSTAKFESGKADVFSLGMTILELVLLEDLFTLNRIENNDRLLGKLDSVPFGWLKHLLYSMLKVDYHERRSFKQLLDEINGMDIMY